MDKSEMEKAIYLKIKKSGGLFCQYRPCRRDASTIYDIENIKNGVVYAQTPLNMNDPFDSFIGYSSNDLYEEIIRMFVDEMKIDQNIKFIVFNMLKYKYFDKFTDFIDGLKKIKAYYLNVRGKNNNIDDVLYIKRNLNKLYSARPNGLNMKLSKNEFTIILLLVLNLNDNNFSETGILEYYKLDSLLDSLFEVVENTKNQFMELMKEFLSKITISCFTNSGWDNQLMWAHYANSYSGICIEYDFNKLKSLPGIIDYITYDGKRPLLNLKDIGIEGFDLDKKTIKYNPETDISSIIKKMLHKNKCWEYEKEWRVINVGDAYKPVFLDLPYIKSITFGPKIDPICKEFLYDICCEKGIDCFDLIALPDSYKLERRTITDEDMIFDIEQECDYISILIRQMMDKSEEIEAMSTQVNEEIKNHIFKNVGKFLDLYLNTLTNGYFYKLSINRLFKYAPELSNDEAMNDILSSALSLDSLFVDRLSFSGKVLPLLLMIKDGHQIVRKYNAVKEIITLYNNIMWNDYISNKAAQKENYTSMNSLE